MSRTTTVTIDLDGLLSDFVAANVGENGSYESISEYVCDLRHDDLQLETMGPPVPPQAIKSTQTLGLMRHSPPRIAGRPLAGTCRGVAR
jgi:hypothetical protein